MQQIKNFRIYNTFVFPHDYLKLQAESKYHEFIQDDEEPDWIQLIEEFDKRSGNEEN